MPELTKEQTQKLFDSMQCNDCLHQLNLSIHTPYRSKGLVDILKMYNISTICTLFENEGIGEIGNFTGTGCEGFLKQSEELRDTKERINKNKE